MGKIKLDNEAEPSTPTSGDTLIYVDSTSKKLSTKDDAGAVTEYGAGGGSYTHPNHSGEVTSTGDGAQVLDVTAISNKTLVTAAVDDNVLIEDATDGALKQVTVQTIVDLASPATPTWTAWSTVTINNGGTLAYTTANGRYYIDGKILYAQFDFDQTAAGSGSTDITIDPPGGVTLLGAATCGIFGGMDVANDGQFRAIAIEADAGGNKFKLRRDGVESYIRGGTFIGNNNKTMGFCVTAAIA